MAELIGTLKVKFDTQVVSEKFKKREFVLVTEGNTPYPQYPIFQLTQDKCELLDLRNEGDEIKVQFNVRGREWNGPQGVKYFNTLEAWRIEKIGGENAVPGTQPTNSTPPANNAPAFTTKPGDNDDLPF